MKYIGKFLVGFVILPTAIVVGLIWGIYKCGDSVINIYFIELERIRWNSRRNKLKRSGK